MNYRTHLFLKLIKKSIKNNQNISIDFDEDIIKIDNKIYPILKLTEKDIKKLIRES